MDGIIAISTALRKRTEKPNLWKERQAEAERRTHASFVAVFGGSSLNAQKPVPAASAQKADDGAGQVRKDAQGASDVGLGAKVAKVIRTKRKGGAK